MCEVIKDAPRELELDHLLAVDLVLKPFRDETIHPDLTALAVAVRPVDRLRKSKWRVSETC